jgi:deazaflavin-dependent oxidoreductase (nitroreductase family)
VSGFNDKIIDEFRSNAGHVTTAGFGDDLVLVHSIGAKSGAERISPLMAIADGDAWLVAASAGGSHVHPAWYYNLIAHPETTIETPTGTVDVTATELDGDAHAAGWAKFIAHGPAFASYQDRAGARTIPVMRLTRR